MAAFLDNCRFISTAGGTTDWIYSSAVGGCQSPAVAGAVDGRKYKFLAISSDLIQWEIAEGAYTAASGTFARALVLYNSSGTGTATGQSGAGSKVNFTAAPNVAIVGVKEDLIALDEANGFTAVQQAQARANINAAEIGTGLGLSNVSFAVSAAAGALTIALKTAVGNDPSAADPIALNFRNAAQSSGTTTQLQVTAATSITIPSGGSLGFSSATAGRVWIVGWNDGGTFRLGVFNASDASAIYPLDETLLASSTLVGGSATAAGAHYTAGAAVTSKAFRILGYADWNSGGVAVAGTWTTTNLNGIQSCGPGVKKPGDIVRISKSRTTTASNTTSTTFSDSTLSKTLAPVNAANLFRVSVSGSMQHDVSTAGLWYQLVRDTTLLDIGLTQSNGAAMVGPLGMVAFDKPNTVSSVTYKIQIRTNISGNNVSFPSSSTAAVGGGGAMLIEELMG